MEADTGRAAESFDDLPDPVWEVGAGDLAVRTANAAARAAGIAVHDLPDRWPTTPAARAGAVSALRATLRSGRARRGLDWTLSGVRYDVGLVRVLDEDGRVRGVLVQARAVPDPARLHLLGPGTATRGAAPGDPGPDGPGPDPATAGERGRDHEGGLDHHPARVPVTGGFRLAAHRVAGATPETGDWFGTLALAGGRLALVVGGVPVPGADRAGVGVLVGALRAVLTESLRSGEPLAQAVRRADGAATRSPGGRGATLSAAVLDPSSATVEHVSRGHCPPLVCDGGGVVATLDGAGSGPLGVGAPDAAPRVDPLPAGSALVLCSIGLLERPRRPVTAGMDELAVTVGRSWHPTDAPAAADALCARVLDRLPAGATGVLVAATVPDHPPRTVETRIAADPMRIVAVRDRIESWLRQTGAPADTLAAVPIVVSELVTNAVQHAYPPGVDGPVRVHACHENPSLLLITVADDGRWTRPSRVRAGTARRGLGLAVARELADDLDLDPGPRGTTVRARFELSRPVVVRPGAAPHLRVAGPGFGMLTTGEPPTRLQVHGPVDSDTADELRSALLHATAGGTRAITLDLAEATLLGAAAVRVLHEFARFADPAPAVRAPEGSVARAMLGLAGLGGLLEDAPGPGHDRRGHTRGR